MMATVDSFSFDGNCKHITPPLVTHGRPVRRPHLTCVDVCLCLFVRAGDAHPKETWEPAGCIDEDAWAKEIEMLISKSARSTIAPATAHTTTAAAGSAVAPKQSNTAANISGRAPQNERKHRRS